MKTPINLSSDTSTRPTPAMREAIARADVGDEQAGTDPTVNALTARVADLLGKEAALWLPTGTMCNLVAVKTHTQPGQTVLVDHRAHVLRLEAGGAALASGVVLEPLPSAHGQFTAEAVLAAIPQPMVYTPPAALLCVEQTHNLGGGSVWRLDELTAVAAAAHGKGLAVHMDGARLMNAVVAAGTPAAAFAAPTDSLWLDFTKGLGAPIGAVLAGSAEFIARARRYKHVFGGAMRQAGIAAAACLYALDHNIERLADDHANMARFAAGLRALPGLEVAERVDTNIVFFRPTGPGWDAGRLRRALAARGVLLVQLGERLRAVTHLDVDGEQIEEALAIMAEVLNGPPPPEEGA
jgi:threonine aldolase